MRHPIRSFAVLVALPVLAAGCDPLDPLDPTDAMAPGQEASLAVNSTAIVAAPEEAVKQAVLGVARGIDGMRDAPTPAELVGGAWLGTGETTAMGGEFFFADRGNKRLPLQWVPGDPRRNGRTDIGYAAGGAGLPFSTPLLSEADVDGAVDRAMATWAAQACSPDLVINEGTFLDWLNFDADVLHAGFVPLAPGVLAVTAIFAFPDGEGEFTDIDNDGAWDTAFAFILYNSDFPWRINAHFDLETVALHEAGHGLGQDHFGMAFRTLANGRLHFAPLAVMNASYSGIRHGLLPTDVAGHCGIFGSWPIN